MENIDADLNRVLAHLGMPATRVLLTNTRVGWLATPEALNTARVAQENHLTERSRALLRKRYAGDFALGGYSLSRAGAYQLPRKEG